MTKRFIFKQNGNFHTVIDTVENKSMGVFEFKENEFGKYACFHMIIDKMNYLDKENRYLREKIANSTSECEKEMYPLHEEGKSYDSYGW